MRVRLRKMINRIFAAPAFTAAAVCFLANPKTVFSKEEISTPFSAELRRAEILHKEGEARQLYLKIAIYNQTDKAYDDVWFELKLNEEMRPYIASGVLKFTSDKMDVIAKSAGNALSAEAGAEKPSAAGFEHGWNMTLTTEKELKDYFNLTPEGITQALQQIEITINWKNGKQTIVLPIDLKSDMPEEKGDNSPSSDSVEEVMKDFLTEYYTFNKDNRRDILLKDMDTEEYYKNFEPLVTEECLGYLEANRMPFKYDKELSVCYTSVEVTDIFLSPYADTTYDYTVRSFLHTEDSAFEVEVSGQISLDEEQNKVYNFYEKELKEVYDILKGNQLEEPL